MSGSTAASEQETVDGASTRPLLQRLGDRLRALPRRDKVELSVLALLTVVSVVLQLILVEWYIEDAAISFAFARNLATGEGLVASIGGERVEGYSNPLWVFLLAGFYLVGVGGFTSSKILAVIFGAACVPLVWAIAREARPESRDGVPLLAALFVAVSAQFAIWNASGLENSLFNVLLAGGILRVLVEGRRGGWPISAVLFFLLSITRPEAILYAAFGGFWAMVLSLQAGRGIRPTLAWLAAFFVPFVGYQAWRYLYFAWEFPNTYYAKTGQRGFQPFEWDRRGWTYLRNFSHELWHGWLLPVYIVGLVGLRRWRAGVFGVALVALAVALYPGPAALQELAWWPELAQPDGWVRVRVWTLAALAGLLPLAAIGRPGWRALILCWGMAFIALFFSLWSHGDWMRGFRWMSLLVVPAGVLFAVGAGELADLVQRAARRFGAGGEPSSGWSRGAWVAAVLVGAMVVPPNIQHFAWFADRPETGPFQVQRRVNYMNYVARRLHLDRVVNLDVDQGAFVYWSGHEMMDLAGLVDVPLGQHRFERAFVREYVFQEMKPHFAHVHGGWARSSRIPNLPEWRRDYFEIPGYPTSARRVHIGNHIRKDLLMQPEWHGTEQRVRFEDGVELVGFEVPAPEAGRGRRVYLEVGLQSRERAEGEDFRVLAFLADARGNVASWDLPPGYDWYEPHRWRPTEVFVGRHALELKGLPPGRYDLGFVVFGPDGAMLLPVADQVLPEGAVIADDDEVTARFARGEVRFRGAVRVLPRDRHDELVTGLLHETTEAAAEGRCAAAEDRFHLARRHMTGNRGWEAQHRPPMARAIADCWAGAAIAAADRDEQVDLLQRGWRWDHRSRPLRAAGRPVADALYHEGLQARAEEDWEAAYRLFSDVLRVDRTRSWARRYAEEARAHRLGFDPDTRAEEEARRERARQLREERRQQREAGAADAEPTNLRDRIEQRRLRRVRQAED